jgi:L-ascorbate metabolism protein UlaG (beta-lactamase superfamily)
VLVRYGGFTFLTDPNFLHRGDHAYLGLGLRSRRLTDPALELEDLPALDFVLLSHHHGDHFDQIVAERLPRDLPIITEPGSADKLRRQGFTRPIPLRTWQTLQVRGGAAELSVTATPAKHAPQPLRAVLPSVMGSVLEFGPASDTRLRMYVTGDTLYHEQLREIPARYPHIDICVIHLGGTRIAGVLLTMDAEQGVRALKLIRPAVAVPVHYDDYGVFKSPLADFTRAAAAAQLDTDVKVLGRGETYDFTVPPRMQE